MKRSRGNLLITFIMIVALSVTVYALLSLIGIRLRESGVNVSEIESFYAADAGLNKAIWYMATPTGQGGKGPTWRGSTYEAFGWGGYYITVADYATDEAIIISTGEVAGIMKTVSQVVDMSGVPSAFDYGVYCDTGTDFTGNVQVKGDVYLNGDSIFGSNTAFTDGYVYHPTGTTLSGGGTWTDGGAKVPAPTLPAFDSSYYDNLIITAQGVSEGNVDYSGETIDLNGGTIYVNGDVTISGNTTINGPGEIVCTGTFSQSGNTYTSSTVKFISDDELSVTGNTYTSGATYYSATDINAAGNTRVEVGAFLTKGPVKLSGNLNISGMIYAESGASFIIGNPVITGSLVVHSFDVFSGNANVQYDDSVFPSTLPTGFTPSTVSPKKGTWRGN